MRGKTMKNLFNLLKISGKIIFLIAGVGVLYAYAMFQGGFVSWFLLYSFFPFILFSLLFALYPLKYWKVARVIDHHVVYTAGDTAKIQIQITRKLPFPLYYLVIKDTSSSAQGHKKLMVYPFFKRKMTVTYEIEQLSRGEFVFDEITIASADFLGFIKKEQKFLLETKLTVYPKRQPVNLFFLEKQTGEGMLARGLDLKKETMIPTSIREYRKGDRLSWINWKMTAKKNTLISKEFEKTEDHHYVVCMDRSLQISPDTFEKIVFYTASLVDELYKTGYPVTLISAGEERNMFPLKKSAEWKQQVLYHLAIVKNDSPYLLLQMMEREKAVLPERGTIIFVTDSINSQFLSKLKSIASSQRKIIVVLSSSEGIHNYYGQLENVNIWIETIDEDFVTGNAEVETV